MPKRKSSDIAKTQPSFGNVPPPEIGKAKKPSPKLPAKTPSVSHSSDLFIVDNSDEDWKAARYLRDWCEIAKRFDIATGYFEIGSLLTLDGHWQKLEQIRILMGDEVSLRTRDAFEKAFKGIAQKLDDSLEREKEKDDFLRGVPAIAAALESGKIACKVYKERKFHAKAYITHAKFEVMPPVALVGSSNFTYPGLHENIELNIQVRHDVDELQKWYEKYWEEAEEVTPDILKIIQKHTRAYSPFEVYAKSLHEFFRGHELTATEWEVGESKIYRILDQYQREGYHALLKIADTYNGALMCDGVGLGKTFIGLMLIERLLRDRKRIALIVPKAAREPVWESKLNKHLPGLTGEFSNFKIYNHTDLLRGDYQQKMADVRRDADVVIIDEAHHFRNQASKRYRKLFEMLEGKTLFLLTATPINNSLFDLHHLIELFSRKHEDYFQSIGINSLRYHFIEMERALERLVGSSDADTELTMAEAEQLLAKDDLTRRIVVQRSRAYAKRSQQQFGESNVIFPDRKPPHVADYSLKKTYGSLLSDLKKAFFRKGKPPLLSLAVYYPLGYPKQADAKVDAWVKGRQAQVVGLIRTQLLKRFESSASSFEATCERLLLKLLAAVTVNSQNAAEKRRLERWQDQNSDLLERVKQHHAKTNEEEAEDDVLSPELLEAAEVLNPDEFNVNEILDETYLDMEQLISFLDDLKDIRPANDDKLQALIKLFETDPNLREQKVLIFSEYMETAQYIYSELKKAGVSPIDVVHSSVDRDRGEIISAFSPYYNDSSSGELKAKGISEIRVLISTDVLSEGLNLQDATLLINYDLHWNPVRLMQRIGRVDRRLDSKVEAQIVADHPEQKAQRGTVHFWNFLPPEELNDLLSLYEKVAHKTLRISKVFGIEGKKLLTPDDDYEALREFTQAYEGTPSSVEQMRLTYQGLLQKDPSLEAALAAYPLRVFSGKTNPTQGVKSVFFCYTLPAQNVVTGVWDDEASFARWYLYDIATEKVLADSEAIHAVIQSEPATARQVEMSPDLLSEMRRKVEKHIASSYLRPANAPLGVKPVLKTWMELN